MAQAATASTNPNLGRPQRTKQRLAGKCGTCLPSEIAGIQFLCNEKSLGGSCCAPSSVMACMARPTGCRDTTFSTHAEPQGRTISRVATNRTAAAIGVPVATTLMPMDRAGLKRFEYDVLAQAGFE
jgi:hypothetical protein